ncbi:MAG: hypothetical protein Faunusvirus34_1, partial [Faunusvirus sp.]
MAEKREMNKKIFDKFMKIYKCKRRMGKDNTAHKTVKDEYTHTSMGKDTKAGKWNIPDTDLKQFHQLYATVVENGEELYLTERHQDNYGPIIIDFDFRLNKTDDNKRYITDDIINKIVEHLTKSIKLNILNATYTCIVLQRPKPYICGDIVKDGLHIQFPHISVNYKFQHILRQFYIANYIVGDLADIPLINTYEDIYDKAVIQSNNWCMYGSTKENIAKYELVKCYNENIDITKLSTLEKIELLSIRHKPHNAVYNDEVLIDKYYNELFVKPKDVIAVNNDINPNSYNPDSIDLLLNSLSLTRCNNYTPWWQVGICLYNTDPNLFNTWDEWSKKSSKYISGECMSYWNGFMKNYFDGTKLSIGSLYQWCKDDNINAFNKVIAYDKMCKYSENFKNNLEINDIKLVDNGIYHIYLVDKYCDIAGKTHEQSRCYIEVTSNKICMKCNESTCKDKIFPSE